MANSVKIVLKAYDHKLIDASAKKIVDIVNRTGSKVQGPVPLPTKKEVFTILRSPHVNKTSREQFERRTHKRLIIVTELNSKTIDSIMKTDIPSGVSIQINQK